MRPRPRSSPALLAALAAALAVAACGGDGTKAPAVPERAGVQGVDVVEGNGRLLGLRSPVLPLFVGGGSPPPEEPIAGLDAELSKAFPDQVRGSGHPWRCLVVEAFFITGGQFALVLEDVGTWPRSAGAPPPPTPLVDEPLDVPWGEKVVVAFGVRDRSRVPSEPARRFGPSLRWAVVRCASRPDGTEAVASCIVSSRDLPPSLLPENDERVHFLDTVGAPVGSRMVLEHFGEPYVLAAWAWWPASGGRSWSLGRGGEVDFTVDGVKYAPGAWPHPLWRLTLRDR